MLGDVEVQNASTTMSDHKEAIEHTESDRWHGEEVHRRDGFPVISNKGEPAFGWLRVSRRSFHPAGNRSLRDLETEHEKLAVDARRSPSWILGDHSEDQLSNFSRRRPSPDGFPHFGNELPVQPEAGPMPSDHRFRGDDDEGLFPTRPDSPSNYPEEPVEGAKAWPSMPPLQHGKLLAEHKVLKEKIPTATKEAKERAEAKQKQVEHGSEL